MYQVTVSNTGVHKLSHPCGNAKASFDLLKTYGRDVFRELVDEMNLQFDEDSSIGYVWHGNDVAIRTYNNPFTGLMWEDRHTDLESPDSYFYPRENRVKAMREYDLIRPPEPAYCSYVHITGTQTAVEKVFNHLNDNGTHDGASGTDWIV